MQSHHVERGNLIGGTDTAEGLAVNPECAWIPCDKGKERVEKADPCTPSTF